MSELVILVNKISERDRVVGFFLLEMIDCYENNLYRSSLSILFQVVEQTLRFSFFDKKTLDIEHKMSFHDLIDDCFKENVINKEESAFLHQLRKVRNTIFHGAVFGMTFDIFGISYPIEDDESYKKVFDIIALKSLKIVNNVYMI